MFLVSMRSPRRVEHFAFFAQRIPTVRFPYIEKRTKRRKKIKNILSLMLSLPVRHLPLLILILILILFYFIFIFCVGPTCHLFFHFLIRFSSETNHFVPVSISFIIIEYSLHIYHFSRFFLNPVFKFNSTLVA